MTVSVCPAATEPEPGAVLSPLSEVVSADARTASSPLGKVVPPDQLAEARLVPTVCVSLKSASVKVSVPEVVSRLAPPALIVCSPELSAAKTARHWYQRW